MAKREAGFCLRTAPGGWHSSAEASPFRIWPQLGSLRNFVSLAPSKLASLGGKVTVNPSFQGLNNWNASLLIYTGAVLSEVWRNVLKFCSQHTSFLLSVYLQDQISHWRLLGEPRIITKEDSVGTFSPGHGKS